MTPDELMAALAPHFRALAAHQEKQTERLLERLATLDANVRGLEHVLSDTVGAIRDAQQAAREDRRAASVLLDDARRLTGQPVTLRPSVVSPGAAEDEHAYAVRWTASLAALGLDSVAGLSKGLKGSDQNVYRFLAGLSGMQERAVSDSIEHLPGADVLGEHLTSLPVLRWLADRPTIAGTLRGWSRYELLRRKLARMVKLEDGKVSIEIA